jgi:hypothetical protein
MASSVRGFEFLLSQLAYDHVSPAILARSEELQGRMQLILPITSALADILAAAQKSGPDVPAGFVELQRDIGRWMDEPLSDDPEREAALFRMRIAQLEPARNELTTWQAALLSSALWRLRQLVDLWVDCRSLRLVIVHERRTWRPRFRHWRIGTRHVFLDRGLALFSASRRRWSSSFRRACGSLPAGRTVRRRFRWALSASAFSPHSMSPCP